MVVSVVPDLLMRSKIDVACRHYGVPVVHATTPEALQAALGNSRLVVIDLDAPGLDGVALVRLARGSDSVRVVGFCSHVMVELIQSARAAGAHQVMANSTFSSSIPGLVAELAADAGGQSPSTA